MAVPLYTISNSLPTSEVAESDTRLSECYASAIALSASPRKLLKTSRVIEHQVRQCEESTAGPLLHGAIPYLDGSSSMEEACGRSIGSGVPDAPRPLQRSFHFPTPQLAGISREV